jgi:hypothetical protein
MLSRRALLSLGASTPLWSVAARAGEPQTLFVVDNRLFLDITINGHAVRALLDSAAEASFVDADFARRIGLAGGDDVVARGSGGDADAAMAAGVRISALGLSLGPLSVAVLDLSDVGRRLVHGPLSVIMGRELFDAARLSIDINRGRIEVVPSSVRQSGEALALRPERGIETFAASIEGHAPVQAAIDLGNGGPVLIGADYAREMGLLTDGRAVSSATGGGIGGAKLRQTLTLRSLNVANRVFHNVPATIDTADSATKLNIGVPVLRRFRIVTDFNAGKLWLRPV